MTANITAIGEVLFDVFPTYKKLGGAPFNFAYHINKLLGNVNFISAVGEDKDGQLILNFMKEHNFDSANIQLNNYGTGLVKVELNEDKIPTYIILENRSYDFINTEEIILKEKSDIFYIGTLAQRNKVSRSTITNLLREQTKVFYDVNLRQNYFTKDIIENSLIFSSIVKLNHDELLTIMDLFDIKKKNILEQDAITLKKLFNLEILIVTMGEDGAVVIGENVSYQKDNGGLIADTVGAGDAFSAMFCAALISKKSLDECNRLAVNFAAYICSIEGAIPDDDDIYQHYMENLK